MIKNHLLTYALVTTILSCNTLFTANIRPGTVAELEQLAAGHSPEAVLNEILANNKYVVIDFWAPWCGPCRNFAPQFAALAAEFPQAVFIKANIDVCKALSQRYGIQSIPAFILFKNEGLNDRTVGGDKRVLKEKIIRLVAN